MELKRWIAMAVAGTVLFAGGILQPKSTAEAAGNGAGTAESETQEANINEAVAGRLSIFHDYDISVIGDTPGELPDSTDGGFIAPYVGSWADLAGAATIRSWSISESLVFGYDSNPQGLASARSSPFIGADMDANWGMTISPQNDPTRFTASYDVTGAVYRGETKGADSIQQAAAATVQHSMFDDTVRLGGLFRDQYTIQNGRSMLNTIDLAPSLEAFWLPQLSGELDYEYSHMDYYYPLLSSESDPDTSRNQLTVQVHFYTLPQPQGVAVGEAPDRLTEILRRLFSRATVGYTHVWNFADGPDYQYEANRVFFGFEGVRPFPTEDVSFDILLAQELQGYSNPNSETVNGPVVGGDTKGFPRHDRMNILTLRANTRLVDLSHDHGTLGSFLQWDVINDRSNIHIRGFNEYIISAGLVYRY